MTRLFLTLAAAASLAVGTGPTGEPDVVDVGVVVEQTAGRDAGALTAARAEVARLSAGGSDAELRIARSPSEAMAAAATLVTRGADRLVLHDVDDDVVRALRGRAAISQR